MRRTIWLAVALAAACGGSSPPPEGEAPVSVEDAAGCRDGGKPGAAGLRVMSRNLYLGAEITAVATAQTPEELVAAATKAWHTVRATHFPARAEAIAAEVEATRPDVIGLQEVTTWRLGAPAVCGGADPSKPTAAEVAYDWLEILQRALHRRGLDYEVVAQATTMDVELCMGRLEEPETLRDLRYTDREVLLVRRGVAWRAPLLPPLDPPIPPGPGDSNGGVFAATAPDGTTPATACFAVGGAQVCSWRGWVATEVRHDGGWARVFSTHLEDWLDGLPEGVPPWIFQAFQATELVGIAGGLWASEETRLPTLAVGDMNAYATPAESPPVYAYLTGGDSPLDPSLDGTSPFGDAWTALRHGQPGFTWGFEELLYGGKLTTRLDLLLATPDVEPLAIGRVGVRDRAWTGQHPSDHAGLVGAFGIP